MNAQHGAVDAMPSTNAQLQCCAELEERRLFERVMKEECDPVRHGRGGYYCHPADIKAWLAWQCARSLPPESDNKLLVNATALRRLLTALAVTGNYIDELHAALGTKSAADNPIVLLATEYDEWVRRSAVARMDASDG